MTNIDWFNFEKKDLDFPIYNNNPHISTWGWIVLFFTMFLGYIFVGLTNFSSIISLIIMIVPLLYFLKWDYHAIIQRPSLKEIGLAVALCVGYFIYAFAMGLLLENIGIVSSGTIPVDSITIMSTFSLIFDLMIEELLKFIPFMFFMRVVYKYSNNRKLAVIVSMIIVMLFFASLHAYNLTMLIFAIMVQGFGSIFEFYGYIKTKNLLIPYITHLCTDVFIFVIVLAGIA